MHQTSIKGVWDEVWQGGKNDPLGIVRDTRVWT